MGLGAPHPGTRAGARDRHPRARRPARRGYLQHRQGRHSTARLVWFVRLTRRDPLDPVLERLADGFIGDRMPLARAFPPLPG